MVADGGENGWQVAGHLLIAKPQDEPAETFDGLLAVVVIEVLIVLVVNGAVQFDDQPERVTCEVGEIDVDRMLAAESETVETAGAKVLPEDALRVGLALTQGPSARRSSLPVHAPQPHSLPRLRRGPLPLPMGEGSPITTTSPA